jgi:hypothetical protein
MNDRQRIAIAYPCSRADEDLRSEFKTIEIGVENPSERFAIADPTGFANDVIRALTAEEEDGSTLLTDLLDAACKDAVEDGAEHFIDRLETQP